MRHPTHSNCPGQLIVLNINFNRIEKTFTRQKISLEYRSEENTTLQHIDYSFGTAQESKRISEGQTRQDQNKQRIEPLKRDWNSASFYTERNSKEIIATYSVRLTIRFLCSRTLSVEVFWHLRKSLQLMATTNRGLHQLSQFEAFYHAVKNFQFTSETIEYNKTPVLMLCFSSFLFSSSQNKHAE